MFNDTLVKEFHPSKNQPKTITDYKPQSSKKIWWKCSINEKHEWESSLSNRTKGTGCPFCSGRSTDDTNNLFLKFPDVAAEWHPTKNAPFVAQKISPGSNKKFWWMCSKNSGHEWEAAPNTRTSKGTGCPHCTGKTTYGGNTVGHTYPHLIAEWDTVKNDNMTAFDFCPVSEKKVWWLCQDKKHSYCTKISCRTKGKSGCPICKNKTIVFENSLECLFPAIAAEWHPTKNGSLKARDIGQNNSSQIWWKCSKEHEWQATPTNRTRFSNSCPACSGRVASKDNNLLIAHPKIAAEWHPRKNGSAKPEDYTPSSHSKVWWFCSKNHDYYAQIANRTIGNKSGCPICKHSKMESKTFSYLKDKNVSTTCQMKFKDMRFNGYSLSYDFYLPEYNAAIECDGRQHFEEAIDYFHHEKSFSHQRRRDIIKNAYAARQGIALLRIAYTEEKHIERLLETFLARLERGERPYNFVGRPYKYGVGEDDD